MGQRNSLKSSVTFGGNKKISKTHGKYNEMEDSSKYSKEQEMMEIEKDQQTSSQKIEFDIKNQTG